MHEGHRERVKNRYLKEGLDSFEDHQVLELLLFFSIPRCDTNETAHRLMKKYGSLSAVFEADVSDLMKTEGIGKNSAILLSLIPSLARKYFTDRWGSRPILNTSYKAGQYAVSLLAGKTYEAFYVICLDSANKVNFAALVHEGTINEAPVYPRIVVETALRHKANSVILAHNHPGGTLDASMADISITKKIIAALEPISVKVLDHIIVAGNNFRSFAQDNLL